MKVCNVNKDDNDNYYRQIEHQPTSAMLTGEDDCANHIHTAALSH